MNDDPLAPRELTDEEAILYREYLQTLHAMDDLGYACFEMRRDNLSAYHVDEFKDEMKSRGKFWQHYRSNQL